MLNVQEKARNYSILLYPDSMPENTINDLVASDFKIAISPLHHPEESDKNEFKDHYHAVVLFDGPKKYADVNDFFRNTYNTPPVDVIYDTGQAIRYLIHRGFDNKTQYPFELIRANFDIRKYFADDVFIIDILSIIEQEQSINSYRKLIWWLRDHGKFDYLEKVAKMSYFFNKYFENDYAANL